MPLSCRSICAPYCIEQDIVRDLIISIISRCVTQLLYDLKIPGMFIGDLVIGTFYLLGGLLMFILEGYDTFL